MKNLLQKFCLTLVGIFSIMNFSTFLQTSARNSAYVNGIRNSSIRLCTQIDFDDPRVKGPFHRPCHI